MFGFLPAFAAPRRHVADYGTVDYGTVDLEAQKATLLHYSNPLFRAAFTSASRSRRGKKYMAVGFRPRDYRSPSGQIYIPFVEIITATNSTAAATRAANAYDPGPGTYTAVIDLDTVGINPVWRR